MTVTFKDLKKTKNQLGQFMTPDIISQDMVDNNEYKGLIIEPSFGLGSFLYKLEQKNNNVIGVEFDPELYSQYTGKAKVFNQSFYKFNIPNDIEVNYITFVGNPPYRTPAFSLNSVDKDRVKELIKKYKLTGVKEEAVFFIAHAVDLILEKNVPGEIHWVLPTTIFQNSSSAFSCFRKFLNKFAPVVELKYISEEYPDVAQPLCIAKFLVNQEVSINLTDSFVLKDTIEFQEVFKRTWLGSVPCEGILMSCKDEPLDSFVQRLESIFQQNIDLRTGLKYKDKYHLRALTGTSAAEKFEILEGYVKEIKKTIKVEDFSDITKYKTLAHRNEIRWYFRHEGIKNVNFIYIINSNPSKGFYFPGNPTKTSTDYFGYCDYDVNRNSSPGANRVVPIKDLDLNIKDTFKLYWTSNTKEPISKIFEYILHVSKSSWYKEYKAKYQRFYFGLPKEFDKTWSPKQNLQNDMSWDDLKSLEVKVEEPIIIKLKTPKKKKTKLSTTTFNEMFQAQA